MNLYPPYETNNGVLFLFRHGSDYKLSTSDFDVMRGMFFNDDNELCVDMIIDIFGKNFKILTLSTHINQDIEPEHPDDMIGKKYPYSIVLTVSVQPID